MFVGKSFYSTYDIGCIGFLVYDNRNDACGSDAWIIIDELYIPYREALLLVSYTILFLVLMMMLINLLWSTIP